MCRNATGRVIMQHMPPKEVCAGVLDQACQSRPFSDTFALDFGDSPTPCAPSTSIFLTVFSSGDF